MIPDLGRYEFTVLAAYGVTLALLAALVGLSLWRARRVARALTRQEERAKAGRAANGV
ncbi:heme exporter protein CcmD [Amaricoccus solimangrovi]|uniref:Heme exporter protein D n=1 Tax=Amaricoccus solimangrovi TaxID=2589815 RepID=A0A501WYU2_9RHOB|nr:heme exporter protein CcmD [Amaricoccus solimangrovi]TPE53840.1 heme exporter protein CcmD [Amaricoccus solimangrovi]